MDSNSFSLLPERAPKAKFDKSPPSPPVEVRLKRLRPGVSPIECTSESQLNSPPNEKVPMDDLPAPPPATISWSDVKKVKVQRSRSYDSNDEYAEGIYHAFIMGGVSALIIFWAFYYQQGSAWANALPEKQYNLLRPTLMVAGFITFRGFSVLLYGICRYFRPIYVKLLHVFQALTFFCIVIGFLASLDSHDQTVIKNFNSLHSGYGLIALGLFGIQYAVDFFGLLLLLICNKGTAGFLVQIHAALDNMSFAFGVAACITDLTEKFLDLYSGLPDEAIIMTVIGAIIVEVLAVIIYIFFKKSLRF